MVVANNIWMWSLSSRCCHMEAFCAGEAIDFQYWSPGQPSKILGLLSVEDCALMRRDDAWQWHDYICGSLKFHYKYICQFRECNLYANWPFLSVGTHRVFLAALYQLPSPADPSPCPFVCLSLCVCGERGRERQRKKKKAGMAKWGKDHCVALSEN